MTDSSKHISTSSSVTVDEIRLHSTFLHAAQPREDNLTAVILHGAGQSESSRHAMLAGLFADQGISVISLDFVGHGQTGGSLSDNSLALRVAHASAVIEHWTDEATPLILCGFSMSGHTVLRLSAGFGDRIKSLGLFCPATYTAEAENLLFGSDFTHAIRRPEAWRSSLGLLDARQYKGRVAIIVGAEDQVIPWEIIVAMVEALRHQANEVRLEILGGADHKLATWLAAHKAFARQIVRYLAEAA